MMLMNIGGYVHFWQAIPEIKHFSAIPQTHLPLIGPWAKWKHGKSVGQNMCSGIQLEILDCLRPHQLAFCVEKCHPVFSLTDSSLQFNYKIHSHWSEDAQDVGLFMAGRGKLPTEELCLRCSSAFWRRLPFPCEHYRLVRGQYLMPVSVHSALACHPSK